MDSILQKSKVPKTAAKNWGIQKEPVAREAYVKYTKEKHTGFKIEMAGLYVNPESPHLVLLQMVLFLVNVVALDS